MAKKETSKKDDETREISIKVEWIALGILIILLIGSVFTSGFSNLPFNIKSPFKSSVLGEETIDQEELKKNVADFINSEYQSDAEVSEVIEDADTNLLKVTIKIADQEFDSYATKDGKFLFPERLELTTEAEVANYPQKDTPDILLFTMSYCPYGNQAEDFVKPVYDLLGTKANIEPHYVIYDESYGYEGPEYCLDEDNQYCSMHGIGELNQDVRELCTYKYQQDKYWDFVMAANEKCDYSNIEECWEGIAQEVGLNTDQIKSCQADEARDLLAEEVQLNQKYGITGSPQILINEMEYEGNRTPEDFKQAVCASFTNQPGECEQVLDDASDAASGSCN